ncbi:MAG: HlyC/CorC family transporter, partial [Lachnospiraceae bacterium]|nr:HlyC/CorC family transporter [Lachnospiraceae bacterium]
MDTDPSLGIVIILILVFCSALISAAEAAISGVNEANVRKKASEGDRKALKLVKFLDSPRRYLSVIEVLVTAMNIIMGIVYSRHIANYLRTKLFSEFFEGKPAFLAWLVMAGCAVVVIYLIVLFGVLLPKRLAMRHTEKFAYALRGLLGFFATVLFPINWLLEKNVNLFFRIFGFDPNETDESVTEEEIISIVNEGQEQGVLDDDEAEMISNIIEFDEKQARDIMTHRRKVVAVSSELTVEEALEFMLKESFSRFPLYREDIDNIVGILNIRDVMAASVGSGEKKPSLEDIAREPYFIPDTQNIDVLFKDMQSKKAHIAIVIDEYGQTAGIVAMEDILEEIVGDIQDEYDNEEDQVVPDGDGYIVSGDVFLSDLCDETDLVIKEEDDERFDTLNGLLVSLLDRIPEDDEKETVRYGDFVFELMEVKDKVIKLVKMR